MLFPQMDTMELELEQVVVGRDCRRHHHQRKKYKSASRLQQQSHPMSNE